MAIILTQAPQQSVSELKSAMEWFDGHKAPATHAKAMLQSSDGGAQNIPHKIYNLNRDQILAKKGLAAAQLVGWRYIVKDDANQFHVAEVSTNDASEKHSFNSFNEGAHLNGFLAQFNNFSHNEALTGSDYELNVLRIPSCYVMAIWLKEKAGKDLFIALEPLQAGFTAGHVYSSADFMHIVEGIAADMAKQIDRDIK